jgi:hypothetical protein
LYGSANYQLGHYSTTWYYDDIFINFSHVKIQPSLNYSIKFSKIKILPHIGFSCDFKVNPYYKCLHDEYSTIGNVIKTYELYNVKLRNYDFGALAGTSFEIAISSARNVFINLDYEYGNRVIENLKNNTNSKTGLTGLGTNFTFTIGLTL